MDVMSVGPIGDRFAGGGQQRSDQTADRHEQQGLSVNQNPSLINQVFNQNEHCSTT
jgi:hypothetical protein